MAAPTATVTLDKASYTPGQLMTATVTYTAASTGLTLSANVTDINGNVVATASATIGASVVASSSPARTWTKVSDNGSTAVFTATA
jgi:hypothetical protein